MSGNTSNVGVGAAARGEAETPVPLKPRLAVTKIRLACFRNYQQATLDLSETPNCAAIVLSGNNGAGKTNLLEALSLLAPGTGLRRARLDEMDQNGSGPWRISATVHSPDGLIDIDTGRDAVKERRQISCNGKALTSSASLAELTSILWLTPALDRLFVEAGSIRRRFLDRLVLAVTSSHAAQVRAFERAMRERLRLLRGPKPDPTWLTVLERRMAEAAVAVAAARLDLVAHLQSVIDQRLDPFDRPKLQVRGDIEGWLEHSPALDVEERIVLEMARSRRIDAEYGTTGLGTHRSDLAVFDYASMEPAASCSTGRQKALLIAIILAEARLRAKLRGTLPILLLDEITAHLDGVKRSALMESLLSIGAQCWMTGTDPDLFSRLGSNSRFFDINHGKIAFR